MAEAEDSAETIKYGVTWQPDDDATACPICEEGFGVFKRKHHCRFCGLVVCADCMKTKAEHPKTSTDEQICDRCAAEHESICRAIIEQSLETLNAAAAAKADANAEASREDKLTALFKSIDVDGSDQLEVGELKVVFGEFHAEFLTFCDKDDDDKLSLDEWINGIMLETKELSDEDFETQWVERMGALIAERPVPKPMSYKDFIATLADDIEPVQAQKLYCEYKAGFPKEEEEEGFVPDPEMSEKFGVAWQNDEEVANCPSCDVEFGIFTRKHHCRFCGMIACAACTSNTEEHPVTKSNEKCCSTCFRIFEEERGAMAEDEDAKAEAMCELSAKYGIDWQPDDATEKCNCCEKEFGVFTRKHHCRFCGLIVCDDCNKARVMHPKTEKEEPQCNSS